MDKTGFVLSPITGFDLLQQINNMRPSVGGLDGFLLNELKLLPLSLWNIRAQIENLGGCTSEWPLSQLYAYQSYMMKQNDGDPLSNRPLRIYNLLNRVYTGVRC